jgi:hypothetical protein
MSIFNNNKLDPFGTNSLFADINNTNQQINSMNLPSFAKEEEEKKRKKAEQMMKLQNLADTFNMVNAQKSGNAQGVALYSNRMKQRQLEQQEAKAKAELKKQQDAFKANNPDKVGMIEMNELFGFSAPSGRSSTADIDNYNYYQSLSPEDKKVYLQLKRLDEESVEGLESAKMKGKQGGVVVPPLQKKMDEAFANDAVEYLSGGQAQVEANINNLKDKIRILEGGELNVSGPVVGNTPEFAQSIANPAALSFIGDIRDIVFQSLREKLGAQFTEKEGDRLVAAAFDQRLPEAENVKRLQRLLKTIEGAASSKEAMIAHYRKNKTLEGYEQKALTFDSIFDSMVTNDFSNKTDAELKAIYNNGDEATKNAVIRFLEKREK